MNGSKHATETNWIDPDDAPELTDEFFRQADEFRGSSLVRRGVAVVQSVGDSRKAEEERKFMRAVVNGISDLEAEREISLDDARTRLGLK